MDGIVERFSVSFRDTSSVLGKVARKPNLSFRTNRFSIIGTKNQTNYCSIKISKNSQERKTLSFSSGIMKSLKLRRIYCSLCKRFHCYSVRHFKRRNYVRVLRIKCIHTTLFTQAISSKNIFKLKIAIT